MKEPWKKTCNGKVIITLNDEKTEPTEVELPVDLNWTSGNGRHDNVPHCGLSVSKTIVLLSFVFLLGLSTYALWKVQELESVIEDDRDFLSVVRQSLAGEAKQSPQEPILMILQEKELPDGDDGGSSNGGGFAKLLRPEALIGQDDLRSSESQYANHKHNHLSQDARDYKESELQEQPARARQHRPRQAGREPQREPQREPEDSREDNSLGNGGNNDNRNGESEEWMKPLVETFDIFGNQQIEDQIIHNVLMKLIMPDGQLDGLEPERERMQPVQPVQPVRRPVVRPRPALPLALPLGLESLLLKGLAPPASSGFKVFHFNERPLGPEAQDELQQQQQQQQLQQPAGPQRSLLPPSSMKIFQFNEQRPMLQPAEPASMEEDMPKITIQSIKLKLLPLPQALGPQPDFLKKEPAPHNNFEVIRLDEPQPQEAQQAQQQQQQQQQSSEEDMVPRMGLPFPDFIMKSLMPMKNFEIIPLNERPMMEQSQVQQGSEEEGKPQAIDRFSPLPIPLQDIIMKTLLPPPNSFDVPLHHLMQAEGPEPLQSQVQSQQDEEQPQQQQPEQAQQPQQVEVAKVPVRAVKIAPFPQPMIKSVLPGSDFGVLSVPRAAPSPVMAVAPPAQEAQEAQDDSQDESQQDGQEGSQESGSASAGEASKAAEEPEATIKSEEPSAPQPGPVKLGPVEGVWERLSASPPEAAAQN